jgi:phospholipid/cholesterol/gamma-HCH transport system permease protein
VTAFVIRIGGSVLWISEVIGELTLFTWAFCKAMLRPDIDGREMWRNLYRVGVRSLPIVMVTALFAGGIAAIQVSTYVLKFRAYEVVGWGFGFVVFREMGPLLVGLMFSGRVGAHNTAELGTMKVTEQIDALRILAIDPLHYLVLPRVISMVVMMTLLNVVGYVFALGGGMLTAYLMVGVDPWVFWNSFAEYVLLTDFLNGMVKAAAFGLAIGLYSCAFGMTVRGGAAGVGRAVNASVVAAATGIFVFDYLITAVLQ